MGNPIPTSSLSKLTNPSLTDGGRVYVDPILLPSNNNKDKVKTLRPNKQENMELDEQDSMNISLSQENKTTSPNEFSRQASSYSLSSPLTISRLKRVEIQNDKEFLQKQKELERLKKRAKEQKDGTAADDIGDMYYYGIGTREDDSAAFWWYDYAVKLGCKTAFCHLAFMYHHGLVVGKDLSRAKKLYENGHSNGDLKATCELGCMFFLWGRC